MWSSFYMGQIRLKGEGWRGREHGRLPFKTKPKLGSRCGVGGGRLWAGGVGVWGGWSRLLSSFGVLAWVKASEVWVLLFLWHLVCSRAPIGLGPVGVYLQAVAAGYL